MSIFTAAEIDAASRPYYPAPPRSVRTHLPQPEHDLREHLSRVLAKANCRASGGQPDRFDRVTRMPEYIEFYADAIEVVDAEMVADAMQRAA